MPDEQDPTRRLARTDPLVFAVAALVLSSCIGTLVLVLALVLVAGGSSEESVAPPGHHMYAAHVTPRAHSGELQVVGDCWFKRSAHRLRAGVYRFTTTTVLVQQDVMVERMPIELSASGTPVDEAASYGLD